MSCIELCRVQCWSECWCECHNSVKARARMPLIAESDGMCYRRYHNTHITGNGEGHEDRQDSERTVRWSRAERVRAATGGSGTIRDAPPSDRFVDEWIHEQQHGRRVHTAWRQLPTIARQWRRVVSLALRAGTVRWRRNGDDAQGPGS